MTVHEYIIKSKNNIYNYFKKDNICFLDIETTGLSRKYNSIYLIGILYFNSKNNYWYLKQFFADKIDEERELLEAFNEFINGFDLIVTYNGKSFDLPFIKCRLSEFNISSKIYNIKDFDIYREIKSNNSYLNLKNLKLKTIEESLNIYRKDEYSGKDCINFYYQYTRNNDNTLKNNILKHNYDDLYYLIYIFKIFNVLKDIKTTYIDFNENKKIKLEIKDIKINGDIFSVLSEVLPITNINMVSFQNNFNIRWENENLIINLEVKKGLITPTKKCLFIDTSYWQFNKKIYDLSQYMTPDNIILLKVEDKFEMKNIKNILKELILFVRK
ncbi:ribonuclease H-like domain-containing protein [Schnuerera sp. xch1]|uniref:ribonuclease H-like domain-containing protein n=1 Tax=Schnuerera sp. xch1 TaxID=2874283 RepID=UPI001CBD3F4E|nr:ribonuclease H-like domain-containing protein [Schnuerera sp. xch1]MBZ2175293.1 ribonuclease H-like domain-containing protein [Schnuerera sp. xch1]